MTPETEQNRPRVCARARRDLPVAESPRDPGTASALCLRAARTGTLQGLQHTRDSRHRTGPPGPTGRWPHSWGPCNRGLWAYLLRLHHILGHHKGGKHPELLGPQCHVAVHPFHEAGALQHHWQVLCASYRSKEFPNRLAQKPCVLTLPILHFQHSPNYSNLPFFFFPQTLSLAQFEDRIRETGCVQILIYITKGKALTILNSPWDF